MKTFSLRWTAIAASAFPLAALIFLVNPALILIGEPKFPMSVTSWLILAAATVIGGLVLTLPAAVPANRLSQWAAVFYKSLFLVLFLVTVFYPEGGRRLDGVGAEAVTTTYLAIVDLCYAGLIVVFWFVFAYRKDIANSLYSVSLASCALIILYPLFSNPPALQPESESSVDLEYAKDSNAIIILADMLQGSTVEQLFQLRPDLKEEFSGFSAYTRAISPFPFTSYGLAAILSGQLYAAPPDKGYQANLDTARRNSFVTDAEKRDYETAVVRSAALHPPAFTAALLTDLGLTRLTKLPNLLGDLAQSTRTVIAEKRESLRLLEQMMVARLGEKPRKLIFHHNMIPHSPNYYGPEDLSKPKLDFDWTPKPFDVKSYLEETAFFFDKLAVLLDHLKGLGIYDSSLLVVVADHGHWVGEKKELYSYVPGASDFLGRETGDWARPACMYNAAILVKPPFSTGPLAVRHNPLSVIDIRGLVEMYLRNEPATAFSQILSVPDDRLNQVVVFPVNTKKNPYQHADDHVIFQFRGNASDLARSLIERATPPEPYRFGELLAPANELLDQQWIKEGKGAWLRDRPGRLQFVPVGFGKGPYELAVKATPIGNTQQRVAISVNGEPIGQLVFRESKETASITIPEGVVSESGESVTIEFQPLDAVSPAELGLWETASPISIHVYAIRIDAAT